MNNNMNMPSEVSRPVIEEADASFLLTAWTLIAAVALVRAIRGTKPKNKIRTESKETEPSALQSQVRYPSPVKLTKKGRSVSAWNKTNYPPDGKLIYHSAQQLDGLPFSEKIKEVRSRRSSSPEAEETNLERLRVFDQKKRRREIPSGACPAVGPQAAFYCPSGASVSGSTSSAEVRFRSDFSRNRIPQAPKMWPHY